MPRREPRWVRKRAARAAAAPKRPEPRFGVTDYVPARPPASGGGGGAGGATGGAAGSTSATGATTREAAAGTAAATAATTSGPAGGAAPGDGRGRDGRRRRRWRLPLAMLVTGLVVGAGGVALLVDAGVLGGTTAAPAPEPTRSTVTVTVPEACEEAGRLAQQVTDITEEIVAATGELDAAGLQVLVDRLQQLDPEVRSATLACRQESPTLTTTTG